MWWGVRCTSEICGECGNFIALIMIKLSYLFLFSECETGKALSFPSLKVSFPQHQEHPSPYSPRSSQTLLRDLKPAQDNLHYPHLPLAAFRTWCHLIDMEIAPAIETAVSSFSGCTMKSLGAFPGHSCPRTGGSGALGRQDAPGAPSALSCFQRGWEGAEGGMKSHLSL